MRALGSCAGPSGNPQACSPRAAWCDGAVAGVVLPFVLAAAFATARAAAVDWHPSRDLALIELHTWDVGTHTPLVGLYSRLGWNHPGPLAFWLLAVPYRALGAAASGLVAGAMALDAVAAALLVVLLRRRCGAAGAAVGTITVLALAAVRPEPFVSPWPPHLAMLPFALTVVAAWSLACGDRLALPILAGAGSFAAQTHLGYVPVTAAASAWGLGWYGWHLRDAEHRARPWPVLLLAACIAVGAWSPVLWDQVAGSGNLETLWRYTRQIDRQVMGAPAAMEIAARVLTPWNLASSMQHVVAGASPFVTPAPRAMLLLPVIAVGSTIVLAWRRGAWSLLMLAGLSGLLLATSIAALAAIQGLPFAYLFVWLWVVALYVWLPVLWLVGHVAAPLVPSVVRRPLARRVAFAAVAVLAAARMIACGPTDGVISQGVGILARAARDWLAPGASVTITPAGRAILGYVPGIAVDLVKAGHPLIVPQGDGFIWGTHRRGDPRSAANHLVVSVGVNAIMSAQRRPGFTRIAAYDPLGEAQPAEPSRLGSSFWRWFRAAPDRPSGPEAEPVVLFGSRGAPASPLQELPHVSGGAVE